MKKLAASTMPFNCINILKMVEPIGFEPTTSSLPAKRSPS